MTSQELRENFLKFFEECGHVIVPSSSLIPDDPSVLLTTAGMQQFKQYYTGELDPMTAVHGALGRPLGSKNTASVQKSFRTSDIDAVGDESHLTFFEMLGNFSFGGYFKERAIQLAWEFVNGTLGIPLGRMKMSVFSGDAEVPFDEESYRIWKALGIPEDKIVRQGREDNFWGPTGNEGPCGPTAEIYVDGIEVWNLVFNEYYMHSDPLRRSGSEASKRLEPLKVKGVDTGMGLERLALVMQFPGHPEKTIFSTDLFQKPLGWFYTENLADDLKRSGRIVADHLRAAVFLIADGVRPSNKEAGHILRRLIRRLIVHAQKFFALTPILEGIKEITEFYDESYPGLRLMRQEIEAVFLEEYKKFEHTLEAGLKEFYKRYPEIEARDIDRATGAMPAPHKIKVISGKDAFYFHQSYGLTIDILRDLAKSGLHRVDEKGFGRELTKHREISRAGVGEKFGGHGLVGVSDQDARKDADIWKMTRLHTATHLMYKALRDVLGPEIKQMGSDITVERTRFDFTFGRKLTDEELKKAGGMVNRKIAEDLPVKREIMPYDEAIKIGALAFFKEKYPDTVSVYSIGSYSRELCGGPHVSRTGEIGKFKILKEESASAGARRIRAVVE